MDGNGTTWPTLNDVLMEQSYLQHLWWMVMVQPDLPWMMHWWNGPYLQHLWWMVMVQPDLPWMMHWWNALSSAPLMDGNGTTWPTLNDVLMEHSFLQHLWWSVMVQPDLPWMMYWWNAPFFSTSDGRVMVQPDLPWMMYWWNTPFFSTSDGW